MPPFDRHTVSSIVAEGASVSEAIAPALRHCFAEVAEEPLPAALAGLVEKLDAAPDAPASKESDHGPSTTETADRAGGGG
jgi:hypothetical protein